MAENHRDSAAQFLAAFELRDLPVVGEVQQYLKNTNDYYPVGTPGYYARGALELGLRTFMKGANYPIGAKLVMVVDGNVLEYDGYNRMIGGTYVQRLNNHAETVAFRRWLKDKPPNKTYLVTSNEHTAALDPNEILLYGTLEPCLMCAFQCINAAPLAREKMGANTYIHSISTARDGELVMEDDRPKLDADGYPESKGAALALGPKSRLFPEVVRNLIKETGLKFTQLQTGDTTLFDLSQRFFDEMRGPIDDFIAGFPDRFIR